MRLDRPHTVYVNPYTGRRYYQYGKFMKCETCGKDFFSKESGPEIGYRRFCGYSCANSGKKHPLYGKIGIDSANWKGGRRYTNDGYVIVYKPHHPNRTKEGYVLEHRLVMERIILRYLFSYEVVHHIDGDRTNNHSNNLLLFKSHKDHADYHHIQSRNGRRQNG